ncbi:MAG: alanine--tRNA ligase, partial [Acidobacteriota bacterium]
MNSQDIRQSFIDFFRQRDHLHLASSPIVAHGDPTLHFTNAGMVQFKDVFLGLEQPKHPRAVTVQKCLRVSGKHNDLENVGPSPRHHTFFEMLGNFSFGDYFKDEAIRCGWELVTGVWGLPTEHLFASVFEEDDEAAELWAKISDLPAERIVRCGAKDNFWAMGDTGPCGPCSEIFVDIEPDLPKIPFPEGDASGRYLEIWNLVFMQFERDASGQMTPLPNPSIDTGAGLERVTSVLQGVKSNYDTDLFQGVLRAAADLASTEYGRNPQSDTSLRVIADHLRATAFLLADGIIPGPDGKGYVLRRLLRRAVRHGMRIGLEEPFLHRLVGVLDETMGSHYTELGKTRQATEATVREEEEKYLQTRAMGARRIQEAIDRTRAEGRSQLSGEEIFQLYDTYGQEIEAVREIAEEEQLGIDEEGFAARLDKRRKTSQAATSELQKRLAGLRKVLTEGGETDEASETLFEGYDTTDGAASQVLRIAALADGESTAVDSLAAGQRGVAVLDRTSFYAQSGGQVGDQGILAWDGGRARVTDTQKD